MYYRTRDLGRGIGMIIFIIVILLYFLFKLIKAYPIRFIIGVVIVALIVFWFLSRRKKRKKEEVSKLVEALKQYKTAPHVKERRAYPYDYSYNNLYYKKMRFTKQSGTERILKKAFDRAGLNIIPQYKISKMTVDFAIPKIMQVIEVDGPHHKQKDYKSQDKRRDYILKKMGWNIWRIKVGEIDNSVDKVVTKILSKLKRK